MKLTDFNKIVDEQVERCLTVLAEKGKEYSCIGVDAHKFTGRFFYTLSKQFNTSIFV